MARTLKRSPAEMMLGGQKPTYYAARVKHAAAITLALLIPAAAAASECATLNLLQDLDEPGAIDGATCATFLTQEGTKGASCHWPHAFRAETARQQADDLWSEITLCHSGRPVAPDTGVNHPDSYDLKEWASDAGTWSVSVKDKGGQNRTLVFLRFSPAR